MLGKVFVRSNIRHFVGSLMLGAIMVPWQQAVAGAIDFRLGGNMAEAAFLTQTASFGYGGADIGFGVLFNEDDDIIGHAAVLVTGSSAGDVKALQFGVGAKLYGGTLDGQGDNNLDKNGGAIAIGGRIRYVFPSSTPFAVLGEAFYAPSVTSMSGFDGLQEYRVALELEVTPSARAYMGYRYLEVTVNDSYDYEVDDSAHIGVRFEF